MFFLLVQFGSGACLFWNKSWAAGVWSWEGARCLWQVVSFDDIMRSRFVATCHLEPSLALIGRSMLDHQISLQNAPWICIYQLCKIRTLAQYIITHMGLNNSPKSSVKWGVQAQIKYI